MKIPAVLILSLVLLAEAMISRFLTGSALHLALVLSGAALFSCLRLLGPQFARPAGFACASVLALGGWHLFDRGLAPISFSELPAVFHVAIGMHFLLWALALGGWRGGRKKAPESPDLELPWIVLGIFAGGGVAWTTATVEIYSTSELLVRSLGFGVLAGCIFLGRQRSPRTSPHASAFAIGPRIRRWRSPAVLWAAGLAAILLAASLVPPAQRTAGKLYTWFGIDDDMTSLEEFGSERPALRTGTGDGGQTGRELPRKANIELDNALRFYIEVDDDESLARLTRNEIYARTSTLSIFADDGRLAPLRSGEWRYDADDGREDGTVNLTGAISDPDGAVTYSVLLDERDSQALPMIARTQSVALGSIFAFADDWYQLALEDHQDRVRFRATSAQRTVFDLVASGESLKIGSAPNDYLRLPATPLVGKIRTAAAELVAESDGRTLDQLLPEVRRWISGRCSYSLRYDNPDDLTPVENFLFGEKKGHCELFAAGTVMLLRSLGIPSRVAYGYCGGEVDSSKRVFAFRESDFHAWSEVYLDGHGWVIFETTPAGDGAVRQPRDKTGGSAFADANLAGYEFLSEFGPVETVRPSAFSKLIRAVTDLVANWFFAICGGVIALGALFAWLRRRGTGRSSHSGSGSIWPARNAGARERTPDFLAEYLRACRGLGFEKRPGQTWGEFLQTLKQAGVCNGEFDELTRYVYGIRYVGRERNPRQEQEFRESVKSFSEALQ